MPRTPVLHSTVLVLLTEDVIHSEDAEVGVCTRRTDIILEDLAREWVRDETVTSLETDLRLESFLINRSDHCQRHVWAVVDTGVVRVASSKSYRDIVSRRVRIDVHLAASVENTNKRVACIVYIKLC